jgi:hypothetical protein
MIHVNGINWQTVGELEQPVAEGPADASIGLPFRWSVAWSERCCSQLFSDSPL